MKTVRTNSASLARRVEELERANARLAGEVRRVRQSVPKHKSGAEKIDDFHDGMCRTLGPVGGLLSIPWWLVRPNG